MSQPLKVNNMGAPLGAVLPGSKSYEAQMNVLMHECIIQAQEGRLYPEHISLANMQRVLDVGCAAGEWIFDLVKRHPHLHIYGIDASEEALLQAKARRNSASLRQIELRHMDLLQPLPIPDEFIDFVHMRRCTRFIRPQLWPQIMRECARVLRPGGWLAIIELELCEISSPSFLAIHRAALQARAQLGRTMDPSGRTFGVIQRLYGMLLQASFEEVSYDLHTIDLGFMGGKAGRFFLSEMMRQAFLIKPLVVQQNILDSSAFDALMLQADQELQCPDLCGWAMLITAYGRRDEL